MPIVSLADGAGSSISILEIDGKYIVRFPLENQEEANRSIKKWKAREDDVLLWAYPKSGTHWLWEIIYQIFQRKLETAQFHKSKYMMEAITEEQFDSLPSPRIMNSHICFSYLPEDFVKKRCKIIYVVRNPKDVAVSFYHHHVAYPAYEYDGKWENYIPHFLDGKVDSNSWFDHVRDYENVKKNFPDYPIHLLYYEDLHTNGVDELKKLMIFLGMEVEDEFLEEVYERNKLQNMRKEKMKLVENNLLDKMWLAMYRKGKVGDWKNKFTVAQNEMFDSEYEKQMKSIDLPIKWT